MNEHYALQYGNIKENDDVVIYQISKAQTNLIETEQLDELKRDAPSFFKCQHYIVDEKTVRVFYKKEFEYTKLQEYSDANIELKSAIAQNLLDIENILGTQYTTLIHPENIYVNEHGAVKFAHRGIRSVLPPKEFTSTQLLSELKMILLYLFTSYSFAELKNVNMNQLAEKDDFINQIQKASTLNKLRETIHENQISTTGKTTSIPTSKKVKSKKDGQKPKPKRKLSLLSGLLIGALIGMLGIYVFMIIPLTNTTTSLNKTKHILTEENQENEKKITEKTAIIDAYRSAVTNEVEDAIALLESVEDLEESEEQILIEQYIHLNTVESLEKAAKTNEKYHVQVVEKLIGLNNEEANNLILNIESTKPEIVIEQSWIDKDFKNVIEIYKTNTDNNRGKHLAVLSYLEENNIDEAYTIAKELGNKDLQTTTLKKKIEKVKADKGLDKKKKEAEIKKIEKEIAKVNK